MENVLNSMTDPSDWKAFPPLKELDSLLRCPICFDYYRTAMMMPNCSHNYCSVCVRKFLALRPLCPTCSTPASDSQLKNNRVLDDLVQQFTSSRQDFLALVTLLGTTKNGKHRLLGSNEPVSRNEPGNCPSEASLHAETPAGIMTVSSEISMTASSMTSVRTTSATSMAVSGVPSMTMSSEASLDEAAGSPHLVPKPPPQIDLDSETVFGDEESCLPIRVVSDTTREGKEKAGRKRELDKVWPSTPTHKRRNSLPASKQPPASAPRGAFSSPMVCGISRTPLRVSHGGMGALEAPSPSSSLLSTPTRCRGGELVGGASPSPATTKVDCPVCGLPVFEKAVNSHLDVCLNRMKQQTPSSSSGLRHQLPRLPKLCFNIMKDKELKKKLREYHLPTYGSRHVMISRLQEFTLQYNAQCDSLNPKTPKMIAQEVEKNERSRNSMKAPKVSTTNIRKDSSTEEIEQHRIKYEKEHSDHFAKLLSEVRERRKKSSGQELTREGGEEQIVNEGGSKKDCSSTSEPDILVLDSPESCSKTRPAQLMAATVTAIPDSPRLVRESTRSKRRHLHPFPSPQHSPNTSEKRGEWEEEDPDFLPPTPFRTRKKQKRY